MKCNRTLQWSMTEALVHVWQLYLSWITALDTLWLTIQLIKFVKVVGGLFVSAGAATCQLRVFSSNNIDACVLSTQEYAWPTKLLRSIFHLSSSREVFLETRSSSCRVLSKDIGTFPVTRYISHNASTDQALCWSSKVCPNDVEVLWRWVSSVMVVFLDKVHRPHRFQRHEVSETRLCVCLHVEPTQLGLIVRPE
jgi:hypothetical protein